MIIIFLRLVRKINSLYERLTLKSKIFYYSQLYKGRFSIHSSLKAGKGFSIKSDLSETTLVVSNGITFRDGVKILLGHSGKISMGANCFFNNNCSINCLGNIGIGNDNQFGENVLLYDHNHQYGDVSQLISKQGYNIGKIVIGNNCWIGSNVVILKDVEIGDNVVIGAGCVIYKSISRNTVVVNQQNLVEKPT
ncbi:MAG TPA: acyltransferase [Hanamia sp.]|nr:acyltransferase [Hanamia sp.]